MSNTDGVIYGGLGMFAGGVAILTIDWVESHERQLNAFLNSLDPNLTTAEVAGLWMVCGFLLFLTGLLIDTYGDEFGGDS